MKPGWLRALADGAAAALSPRPNGRRNKTPARLAPDGFAFPPGELINLVAGAPDAQWYWNGGKLAAEAIVALLARHGGDFSARGDVLDFGCGCGRVIRHLRAWSGARLHGTDYNRTLVRWCAAHLEFAQFTVNRLAPPTRFDAGAFDLVYALSVFTHAGRELQAAWMQELHRLVRPGGWLVLSLHGDAYLDLFSADERARYDRGELVVRGGDRPGENRCAAFHPEQFVRAQLARGFEVAELVREGAKGNPRQDLYLLRRSAGDW